MAWAGPLARRVVSPLQFLMLLQLEEGPKYGYEMLKLLREEFDEVWELKTGTFYPALRSLEARGFVETDLREETEFYLLTEKGRALIDGFEERLEEGSRFTNRYVMAMMRWMPLSLRARVFEIFQKLSEENFNLYPNPIDIFDGVPDKERKLEFLENLKRVLKARLKMVETLQQDVMEGE